MAEILRSVSNSLNPLQAVLGETILFLDAYGTIESANTYFDNMLDNVIWKRTETSKKKSALVEATRLIDNLNYAGDKTNATQIHEFPRTADIVVPKRIEMACYEIANRLLDGVNVDYEADNISAESRNYGGAKTTYNRSFVQEHIAAGIPSYKAWMFLKPYLRDPVIVDISRVT